MQGILVKTDSSVDLGWSLLNIYLTCDSLKPVQTDSAGIGLFLSLFKLILQGIPVTTDPQCSVLNMARFQLEERLPAPKQ